MSTIRVAAMLEARRAGRRRRSSLLLLVAALATGCGDEPPPPEPAAPAELPTVDVGAAPDAAADLSHDAVERRRPPPPVAGVMPSFLPGDLPVPLGSSLVDFGVDGRFVELRSSDAAKPLLERWRVALSAAGWSIEAGSAPGDWQLGKGETRIMATVRGTAAGSSVRLELPGAVATAPVAP